MTTYDVIEAPNLDPETPEEHASVEEQREKVAEAVRDYVDVVEDTVEHYHVKARVPYRITAYRHDIDHEKVDDMDLRVGTQSTDGWVDVDTPIYVTVDTHQRYEFPITHNNGPDPSEEAKIQTHEALEKQVAKELEDSEVEKPIHGTRIERETDDEPQPTFTPDPLEDGGMTYKAVERSYQAGTATYRVDAIVPKDEWSDDD